MLNQHGSTQHGGQRATCPPVHAHAAPPQVEPEALTLLAREAMVDIAHLLRPSHLQQLRNILDDKEASTNDKFVALELLKNANIAAGANLSDRGGVSGGK